MTAKTKGTTSVIPFGSLMEGDRDAFKEVWLLFENHEGRFPLYPGSRVTIEYAYTVSEEKWGQWFQRAVRLPTRNLTVRLNFPVEFEPQQCALPSSASAHMWVELPSNAVNSSVVCTCCGVG